ncbi:MAG: F0F1 ATP synthase subunit epsilon [Ruminococcus sp.]|nr:F0F1 ATP synthase subunit epsilon [Ruminococcus sp.]
MSTFSLIISSPDGREFDGMAEKITMRGANGDFAVLGGHAPFMTLVKPCECVITAEDGTVRRAKSTGGIFQVADDKATFLSGSFTYLDNE